MSTQENNANIVRSLYDAFNTREFDRGAAGYAAEARLHNMATGEMFSGPDGFRAYVSGWAAALPDSQVHLQNVVASGSQVVVEFRGVGTHTGVMHTPMGEIAPTGRAVELPLVEIFKLRDGKVVDHRAYFDSATLLRQIGAIS
jgi:steroid delta-isomerase-like uncharacterized protein